MTYNISIVEFPAKKLVGMKVRTNMQNASTDCSAIWQTFGPRSVEISGGACVGKECYGVSVMVNENDFDYWAASEVLTDGDLPDGMEVINIPAGLYAKCSVAGLAKLSEAYSYLYCQWPNEQSEYALNMQGASFEIYPPGMGSDADGVFEICAAVLKQ